MTVRGQPWIINFHCVCTVVCRDVCVAVREQLVGVSSVCHVAFCDELGLASLAWSAFFCLPAEPSLLAVYVRPADL